MTVTVDTDYRRHREHVLSVLGRRCRWLEPSEREALFHDAYVVMLEKERDGELETSTMHPRQVCAYLAQTALYKALDEGKRAERKRAEPLGEGILAQPDPAAEPAEVVATHFDTARLREIVAELPARGQAIVKLRFFLDRAPEEIQRMLAISPRVYRRELERAMRHVSEQYELVREGSFCETRRSLILAYVAGIAGPNRQREARQHLATCPGCARWTIELREAARRIAVLVPPVGLAPRAEPLGRLGEAVAALRDKLMRLAVSGREHVAAFERSNSGLAGYVSGARPGTVAVLTSCLAIGGGAGYCAVHGLSDPFDALLGHGSREPRVARHHPVGHRPMPARATPRPRPNLPRSYPPPPPPPPPQQPEPQQQPEPPPPEPEPPSEPEAAASEFGLEGSASSAGAEASASAGPPSAPAPAPRPPGEFDP